MRLHDEFVAEGTFSIDEIQFKLLTFLIEQKTSTLSEKRLVFKFMEKGIISFNLSTTDYIDFHFCLGYIGVFSKILTLTGYSDYAFQKCKMIYRFENGLVQEIDEKNNIIKTGVFQPSAFAALERVKVRLDLGDGNIEECLVPVISLIDLMDAENTSVTLLHNTEWRIPCEVCEHRLKRAVGECVECKYNPIHEEN